MFQRKALMGEHIPMCMLAGWGAAMLLRNLQPTVRIAVAGLLVAASAPSNALFLLRDMNHLQFNKSETFARPYMTATQSDMLNYIADKTPKNASILTDPFLALYIPALTGHTVWSGHWSETPDYPKTISKYGGFVENVSSSVPSNLAIIDNYRRQFLAETHCQYLMYPIDASSVNQVDFATSPPPYLIPVYHNKEYVLFKIDLSK